MRYGIDAALQPESRILARPPARLGSYGGCTLTADSYRDSTLTADGQGVCTLTAESATSNPGHNHQGGSGPVCDPATRRDTWTKLATTGYQEYSCGVEFSFGDDGSPAAAGSSRLAGHGSRGEDVPG